MHGFPDLALYVDSAYGLSVESASLLTSLSTMDLPLLDADAQRSDEPVKRINGPQDMAAWEGSVAYAHLTLSVTRLNAAVAYDAAPTTPANAERIERIMQLLRVLDGWVDEIVPLTTPQRFGNRAFASWTKRLDERAEELHRDIVPSTHASAMPELLHHFSNSFGSGVRIDYGCVFRQVLPYAHSSGHELAFIAWLTVMRSTGLLAPSDERAMVLSVFRAYLQLCHRLQSVYNLEPAGSKGVWGLDDHQFLSYLFGSAQFDPASSTPSIILDRKRLQVVAEQDNLFAVSVLHVHQLKRGPFNEHSPMLYSIAQTVPSWHKANGGLFKAWKGEVLGKWPVVQHLYFGRYLSWRAAHGPGGVQDGGAELPITTPAPSAADASGPVSAPWVQGTTAAPWKPTSAPFTVSGQNLADRSGLSSRR